MTAFIIIVIIVIIGIVVLGSMGNAKQKEYETTQFEELKNKGINLTKKTKTFHGIIGVDQNTEKLVLVQSSISVSKTHIIDFSNIYECELIRNGETVYKKSTARTIGGAVIGGVLSGGVGAVIGGLSGGSTGKENINRIELKIVVRDISNPTHRFVFFDKNADNKLLLDNLIREAENWKDTISIIIDMVDKQEMK